MFSIKKFFVPDPVDANEWSGQGALAGDAPSKAAPTEAEAGWDHPNVMVAAKRAEDTAPTTFVDWVDWNAVGAAFTETTEEALEPQKEYEPPLGFTSIIFNYRTYKWDDGNDPNGIYNPIGYD